MTNTSFLVELHTLEGGPGQQRPLQRTGVLEDVRTSVVLVANDAPVTFDGAVEWVEGNRVVITGSASVDWAGECRRCLGEASGRVTAKVREIFEPDPTEGETYPLHGDRVDLEPMVREAVVLELPLAPICKDDCAGLCPQCGVNRNETACDCDTNVKDPRWAALEDLTVDE